MSGRAGDTRNGLEGVVCVQAVLYTCITDVFRTCSNQYDVKGSGERHGSKGQHNRKHGQ